MSQSTEKSEPAAAATTTTTPSSNRSPDVAAATAIVTLAGKSGRSISAVSFEDSASFLSKTLLTYLDPLLKLGYERYMSKQDLNHSDLGTSSAQDKANYVYNNFIREWEKERDSQPDHSKRSLWLVLWRTVGWGTLASGLGLYTGYAVVSFGPVIILNNLTQYFQGTADLSVAEVWICVALLFALPLLASIFAAQSNVVMAHMGLQFRNSLVNMIYRKALKLSPRARLNGKNSTGQIVNMFSNDTAQLQRFLFFVNNSALAPFQIIVSLILIYQLVGPSTFVGLGFMLVLMPLQGMIFRVANAFRIKKMKLTDERVKLTNEILSGIRIIKYYAWEMAFSNKLVRTREEELEILRKMAYIVTVGFTVIMMGLPVIQPVAIFFTYTRLGKHLDAATAFTTIAYFNLMQMPFAFLPMGLQQYSQSLVSTKRMLDFFVAEELDDYVEKSVNESNPEVVISMQNASLGWQTESDIVIQDKKDSPDDKENNAGNSSSAGGGDKGKEVGKADGGGSKKGEYEMVATGEVELEQPAAVAKTLNRSVSSIVDASFSVKKGELIGVVGPVGSGKSSLLGAILGEMVKHSGSVQAVGSIAYCDQRPWILNDTVKGNILFGSEYNEAKFDQAIHAANLEDDIKILPGGIMTEIGERGINLSGGQKARVALARAIYRDADVYLLDDPLSAVDAHVGQHLFFECIKKCLVHKTVILVTHHVHLLPHCDNVLIIDNGSIPFFGPYDGLIKSGIDLAKFIPQEKMQVAAPSAPENAPSTGTSSSTITPVVVVKVDAAPAPDSVSKGKIVEGGSKEAIDAATIRKEDTRSFKLTTIEERKTGDVETVVYSHYIKAGGAWLVVSAVLIMIVAQCLTIFANFWLSYWGAESVKREKDGRPLSSSENLRYLNFFAMFSCVGLLCYVGRALLLAIHRIGTSRKLHNSMLQSVLAAPVAFFDVTPLGRILNRFSSDMTVVDEDLSQTINQVSNSVFGCVGAIGAIAAATKGTFLILIVPLTMLYKYIHAYFRDTNTAIARLASVSKSPIYSDFSQCLTGLTSIRAYNDQPRFVTMLEGRVDHNSIAEISTQIIGQWLAIRLDFLGSLISFFVAVLSVATLKYKFIPAGFLAIGLMYSYQLTSYFKFCVRVMATGEAQMNSVERILFYINHIIKEGKDDEMAESALPKGWPVEGKITGNDVQMAYRNGPLVLKGLNFSIQGKEKVGVAGRTGSGKSSLMIALFRIQELTTGSVYIDDVDISKVPLRKLRSVLGIIPQDPVMFSASVRFNLDPFNEYSDDKIMSVLESVCMKEYVLSLPNKLDEIIAEGGDNLSAGQRQLICIGRALLRDPKILVLDEATASIDNKTDSLIQTMVRTQFVNSTVLTIAHRLHTIIDCDKVMVLDSGNLEEFGAPASLLNNPDGIFKSLWERHQASHHQ